MTTNFVNAMLHHKLGYDWDETFDPIPFEEAQDDEETGKIELTSRTKDSRIPPLSENGNAKRLVKRTNSTSPDGRTSEIKGTLA